MPDFALLAIFIPTFFFVSITPGMCMTLAMTMGMSIGLRRTFWMMLGELVGVALVAIAAVMGVASIMLNYPQIFDMFKYFGGIYLAYIGVQMWRTDSKLTTQAGPSNKISNLSLIAQGSITAIAPPETPQTEIKRASSRYGLVIQGFVTATSNPKSWLFMVTLLPPFIQPEIDVMPQLVWLLAVILVVEGTCLMLYASGGQYMSQIITSDKGMKIMNRVSGSVIVGIGVWMIVA